MWKVLIGMLSEQLYKHVDTNDMLPSEQKGCRKETRGKKGQLLIDRMTLKNCKRRYTNLAMTHIFNILGSFQRLQSFRVGGQPYLPYFRVTNRPN